MDQSQFATLLVVALSRATERILLVMVGALAVYLGYCLFREIPTAKNAEGKVELPGGVSIFLTRIGPGVFFALFGIAVIGYSVAQPVRLDLPNVATLSGLGQPVGPPGPSSPVSIAGPEPREGRRKTERPRSGGPATARSSCRCRIRRRGPLRQVFGHAWALEAAMGRPRRV
jgi:hypothetical protein